MPKNRRDIDREQKLKEILDGAEKLFLKRGYQATKMADLARAAGIAPNAIYWYLPSKDHVLAAVIERRHRSTIEALARDESLGRGLEKTLTVVMSAAREMRPLVDMLRARAAESKVVAAFRQQFNARLREVVGHALTAAVRTRRERELIAMAMMAVVEGALIYETPEFPAEKIARAAIQRLAGQKRRKAATSG